MEIAQSDQEYDMSRMFLAETLIDIIPKRISKTEPKLVE